MQEKFMSTIIAGHFQTQEDVDVARQALAEAEAKVAELNAQLRALCDAAKGP